MHIERDPGDEYFTVSNWSYSSPCYPEIPEFHVKNFSGWNVNTWKETSEEMLNTLARTLKAQGKGVYVLSTGGSDFVWGIGDLPNKEDDSNKRTFIVHAEQSVSVVYYASARTFEEAKEQAKVAADEEWIVCSTQTYVQSIEDEETGEIEEY